MEQKNGMLVGIFSLVICVIIVMGVMTPIVSDWTTGGRTENEGAGWLRMSYESSPSYQSIAADLSGEGVMIYNDSDGTPEGTQTLSGTEDTIIYADNNLALWYENDNLLLLGQIDGEPVFVQRNDAISLIRESDGIRVSATDTPTITFPFPTYAYEPNSEGNYAFFTNGTSVNMESGRPSAIVGGGFAGVYAYNNIFRYAGLGLGMETEYDEDGKLVNVSWDKITEEENTETPEPLGAPYIRIAHEDDVDDIDSVSSSESGGLRAVPTPTYTDGDWGYELTTVSGVQKAIIVSYSGAGGDIVVPAKVGGYDVHRFGKDSVTAEFNNYVFDNSTLSPGSTITFSEGIVEIGSDAMKNITNLTGSLTIPSSVTAIGIGMCSGCSGFTGSLTLSPNLTKIPNSAFLDCKFTGNLTLPSTLTSIEQYSFNGCKFTGALVIPASVTTIGASAFQYNTGITSAIILSDATPGSNALRMSNVTEILDMSDTVDYSANRYGLPNTATVSDSIGDCLGYISFAELGSDPKLTGPIATLLIAVPLLMVVGLAIAAMTVMRGRVQ